MSRCRASACLLYPTRHTLEQRAVTGACGRGDGAAAFCVWQWRRGRKGRQGSAPGRLFFSFFLVNTVSAARVGLRTSEALHCTCPLGARQPLAWYATDPATEERSSTESRASRAAAILLPPLSLLHCLSEEDRMLDRATLVLAEKAVPHTRSLARDGRGIGKLARPRPPLLPLLLPLLRLGAATLALSSATISRPT